MLIQSNAYIVSSDYAIDEARRNLLLKKKSAVEIFDSFVAKIEVVVLFSNVICPIEIAEKDKPIFKAAWISECTHLITGDLKDFGKFMNKPEKTKGICIQTVSDFLDSL